LADAGRGALFLEAEAGGFFAGAEVVASGAIGADEDFGAEAGAEEATPGFKEAAGDEFEVVEVGVGTEDFHTQPRLEKRRELTANFADGADILGWDCECLFNIRIRKGEVDNSADLFVRNFG
jgi:hypothetical protein